MFFDPQRLHATLDLQSTAALGYWVVSIMHRPAKSSRMTNRHGPLRLQRGTSDQAIVQRRTRERCPPFSTILAQAHRPVAADYRALLLACRVQGRNGSQLTAPSARQPISITPPNIRHQFRGTVISVFTTQLTAPLTI